MPPHPKTATRDPGWTRAMLRTAPTPVSTAQLMSAARSSGMRASIATAPDSGTTAYCAKEDTVRKWCSGCPLRESRSEPSSRLPRLIARPAVWQ